MPPFPQAYYREIESIEDLKRAIQFPKLEAPPADFLAQMENYCREAPRPLDEHAHKKVRLSPGLAGLHMHMPL